MKNSRVIKSLKRLAVIALFAPVAAFAASGVHLDKAPVSTDQKNLQSGARLFVNYCLNCHGASAVRYNQLYKIGLDEKTITDNLLFTGEKVGDLMTVAMAREDAEAWFGTAPPDLSLIARAKASAAGSGADYLYTYLRSFYRDPNRPTGWNNTVFANVGMPHALWDLQGVQTLEETTDENGHKVQTFKLSQSGTMSKETYDQAVADLVSFLVWMGEPDAESRKTIGIFVLIFLAGLYVLTHKLGKNYWKDIH
ncbi:MAG: cytochrome c1 [Azoarcus sp.]|jgi:ubiquinol-cytochrome c reductase cytochrome c1 subunit|nr:cytochrome c1 [Azoarcus sp.]